MSFVSRRWSSDLVTRPIWLSPTNRGFIVALVFTVGFVLLQPALFSKRTRSQCASSCLFGCLSAYLRLLFQNQFAERNLYWLRLFRLISRFELYIKRILCGVGLQRWKHALRPAHKRSGPHRVHSPGMQIEFSLHAIDQYLQRALQRPAARLSNDQLQHSRLTLSPESFLVGNHSNSAAGEQDLIALLRSVRDSLDFAAFTWRQSGKRKCCDFADRRRELWVLSQPASSSSRGSFSPICLV